MRKNKLAEPENRLHTQVLPGRTARYAWLAILCAAAALLLALAAPLPPGQIPLATVLYDRQGNLLATLCAENRQPIPLAEVPDFLRRAVIATEDAGFYRHGGISPRGILRAAWRDLTKGRIVEGASTITQQLARITYLNQRRTLWRKLAEVFYAFKLELHCKKDEILSRYLNQVYFGEGAYGVKAGAEAYFARAPGELNHAEQAFLAGVLQSPADYNPWRHPAAARRRMTQVLDRMRACRELEAGEAGRLLALPLRFRRPAAKKMQAPYFVAYVRDFLAGLLPEGAAGVYRAGLQVQTTLDLETQAAAEAALARLDALGPGGPQGCLAALEPGTGAIRALVGGRDFARSPFNRATQARRQPGSAFKPVVYAHALERGYTLATLRSCEPHAFRQGNAAYYPTDAGRPFHEAELSLRDALASSCNVVAVTLGAELGPEEIAAFARKLGLESPLRPYLSLSLGTSEVKPLELAAVYAAFANGGMRVKPFGVSSVRTADGRLLYRVRPAPERAIGESTAFLLTQALAGVFGPGGTAQGLLPGRPAAGKTGTSDGNRDAWFAGYTPDLAAVVHIGHDLGNRPLTGSGGSLAAPIWADFIRRALHGRPAVEFRRPHSVLDLHVCAETGLLPTAACPVREEYFARGTEPAAVCAKHQLVRILVCQRSGLLPGPYCRRYEARDFRPGAEPLEICRVCRGGLLDWLENLFKRPAGTRPQAEEEEEEEDDDEVPGPFRRERPRIPRPGRGRRRGWP